MPRRDCPRHGDAHPCTCAMGNLYRFVEPVLLLLLKQRGSTHGYELSQGVREYALTDAEIERAVLYRTLRTLEQNGNVVSAWNTDEPGPARRVYELTASGEEHLEEWRVVLGQLSRSMARFVRHAAKAQASGTAKQRVTPKARTAGQS